MTTTRRRAGGAASAAAGRVGRGGGPGGQGPSGLAGTTAQDPETRGETDRGLPRTGSALYPLPSRGLCGPRGAAGLRRGVGDAHRAARPFPAPGPRPGLMLVGSRPSAWPDACRFSAEPESRRCVRTRETKIRQNPRAKDHFPSFSSPTNGGC